ncbi:MULTISPECIES: restriction endonuclease subunit S [unclassified Streptomyces]|uniref:restriction endonuclease subunit S n=1 Tax=unclassified Streptomyces TaxID=2593676 RepID=UPI000748E6F0|nr:MULTISPECIES: restriction endonuclease subunit S [unclassified Streptomyces]KUL73011.1 hypothetical protein ADL33_21760 [Streptomyces sp. NRRL WC-3604]KUL73325.1 hypothetical protein ADL34_20810 [Streptomyces sp. NRRL WC-3605]
MTQLTLADLCELVVDCKNRTPPEAFPGEEIAGFSIGTPNIIDGRIRLSDAKPVSRETFDTWTARAVPQAGDIVLTREAPVGRVGRIEEGMRICLGQRTMLLRPKEQRTDSRFLHYFLLSPTVQDMLHSQASGSTVAHLRVAQVRDLRIPAVPELAEQRRIGAVLGALDDKIAVNERTSTTYEKLLQCRYAELGLADEPSAERAVPVTDLLTFNPKVAKPSADEPVYVDMAALQTDRASIPAWTRRAPKSGPRFMNGDTLLARITPCLENGKTGYVDFMEDGEIGLGSTEFIVMRSLPGVPGELSYFLARDSRFRAHAIRNMAGTSGRQRVSAADAANYEVNRPDADALAAFGREASAAFAHMKSLQAESRTLTTLRATLLPQLISGRLRVKNAEKVVEDAT